MSQEGVLGLSSSPSVPTTFVTDAGNATPVANTLNVFGGLDITTAGAGNTITISFSGPATPLATLTGNSGGAVGPTASNINTVGSGSITIVGSPGTSTLTTQLIGLTNHNVLVGTGTGTINNIAPSTAGFVLTSNGAASDPSFQDVSTSGAITSITGNTGGAETPLAGNFMIVGTGSITVAGSIHTETVQLTGLTNHAVLVGAGTATITNIAATANTGAVLQNNSGADPSYSTATYPSTTTINQLLYSSAANTVTGLATANRAVLTTGATGIPVLTALAVDGQLIIGSTAGVPAAATLTAGTGISITNASNSITIAVAGGGFAWTAIGANQTLAVENGYFCTTGGALSLALPATSAVGDTISVALDGSTSWTITQPNAATRIRIGNQQTTLGVGGSLASTAQGDTVELVCETANARWVVVDMIGNITIV